MVSFLMSNGLPASYDAWRTATPWDNERPSDEIEVTLTLSLTTTDDDGEPDTLTETVTVTAARWEAEDMTDEGWIDAAADQITAAWGDPRPGDVITVTSSSY